MGLVRTLSRRETIYMIPENGDSSKVLKIINLDNHRIHINLDGPKEYHFAPESHVRKAGGLEGYIAQRKANGGVVNGN